MSFFSRVRESMAMTVPKPAPRPATLPGAGVRAYFFPGNWFPVYLPAPGNPTGDQNYPSVYRLGAGTVLSNFFDSIFGGTQSGPVESEASEDPGPPDADPGEVATEAASSAAAGAAAGAAAAGGPFGAILGGVFGLANVGAQMYLMKQMGGGETEEPSPKELRQALRQQLTATYTALSVKRAQAAADTLANPTTGGSDTTMYALAAAMGLAALLIWRRK